MAEPTTDAVSDERLREIEPCPFCGKDFEVDGNVGIHGTRASPRCPIRFYTLRLDDPDDIAAWNRRSVTSQASEGEVVAWRAWVNPHGQAGWIYADTEQELISRGIHDRRPLCDGSVLTYSQADFDESYEIGKRDGYERAIQEIDWATGGDGEFKGSTLPGETVDEQVMKQRIIDRLASPFKRVERLEALAECAKLCDGLAKDHDMAGNSDAYSAGMHDGAVRLFLAIKALGGRS